VKDTGFKGWFSVEIFDGGPEGQGRELGDIYQEAQDIVDMTGITGFSEVTIQHCVIGTITGWTARYGWINSAETTQIVIKPKLKFAQVNGND
jgi:hypothetical protein